MLSKRIYGDPAIYTNYYVTQAGHGLDYFEGEPFMQGAGLAGLFRGLFRRAVPLIRRGFEIVKPHVKTAVKGIARDAVTSLSTAVMDKINREQQKGSGIVYIVKRRCKGKRSYENTFPRTSVDKKVRRKKQRGQKPCRRAPGDIF